MDNCNYNKINKKVNKKKNKKNQEKIKYFVFATIIICLLIIISLLSYKLIIFNKILSSHNYENSIEFKIDYIKEKLFSYGLIQDINSKDDWENAFKLIFSDRKIKYSNLKQNVIDFLDGNYTNSVSTLINIAYAYSSKLCIKNIPNYNLVTRDKVSWCYLKNKNDIDHNLMVNIIKTAVNAWTKYTNEYITIFESQNNCDIEISVQDDYHGYEYYHHKKYVSINDVIFNGSSTLAHALSDYIHINYIPLKQKLKEYEMGDVLSLKFIITVIVHEFGHSLGFQHVNDTDSIMYPYLLDHDFDINQPYSILSEKDILTIKRKFNAKKQNHNSNNNKQVEKITYVNEYWDYDETKKKYIFKLKSYNGWEWSYDYQTWRLVYQPQDISIFDRPKIPNFKIFYHNISNFIDEKIYNNFSINGFFLPNN